MKAYKVIFELLKHPFAEVCLTRYYICNHIRYNGYSKNFLLESIDEGTNKEDSIFNECGKECWYDGGNAYTKDYNPCQDCKNGD